MQQAEGAATADLHVHLTDLPEALAAFRLEEELFTNPQLRAAFETLFHSFDPQATFQFFRSFRHVRINFSDALAAAEARAKLNRSDFHGRELRLYFAQSVHIGSASLEPPKPERQFLISPPASPPVGWQQVQDTTPVVNYDLLCAISKLGPGETYELHSGTTTTPSVVVHVCENENRKESDANEVEQQHRPRIIQTRRPEFTRILH